MLGSASCAGSTASSSTATTPSGPDSTDVMFVRRMLVEHQHGIELARIAIARSSYLDLLEFATTISATQSAEVEQMQTWLRERGLDTTDPGDAELDPTRAAVSEVDRAELAAVKGFDFDDVWITLMSAHQQRSIDLAAAEIDGGTDPVIGDLAISIRDSHQQQIDGMQLIYVIKE